MELWKWELIGFAVTVVLGSLLHFVYEWSGKTKLSAVLGAVNESTWEHLKLLFWPIVLYGAVEYAGLGRFLPGFLPVKVLSILLGMTVIVTVFYTYSGVIGRHFLLADIADFVLGAAAAYAFSFWALERGSLGSPRVETLGWAGLVLLTAAFVVFTFWPPKLALFQDPRNLNGAVTEKPARKQK